MTPEAARDKQIGGQNVDFVGRYLLKNSPKCKKKGSWIPPKATRNTKLGVIFAKCAP